MTKTALAIRHVHFETLGTFEEELGKAGYTSTYFDVATQDIGQVDPLNADLLAILGGPIGVYEIGAYPFLEKELTLIRARLDANRPILGICLGAQLIAAALGARVAPTGVKEIGFAPLTLTEEGVRSPLRQLRGVPVLHWHGDAFELPDGAQLLATTRIAKQAFSIGRSVLAVQFHPEADTACNLEPWLIGHACELAAAAVSPVRVREEARKHGLALQNAGRAMFAEWLEGLSSSPC